MGTEDRKPLQDQAPQEGSNLGVAKSYINKKAVFYLVLSLIVSLALGIAYSFFAKKNKPTQAIVTVEDKSNLVKKYISLNSSKKDI